MCSSDLGPLLRGTIADAYHFLTMRPLTRALSGLLGEIVEALRRRKQREAVLTFDDLVFEADRLLAAHPRVAADVAPWIWGADADREYLLVRSFRGPVRTAMLVATCDNRMALSINGTQVGSSGSWERPVRVDLTPHVRDGDNELVAEVGNAGGPSGFSCRLVLTDPEPKRAVAENEHLLRRFLLKPGVRVLYADDQTTHHYAVLYRQLRAQGTPIPTNDMWVAALVLQHNLVLHSRDAHFDSLPQIVRV